MQGFATAGGKEVCISAQALETARKLLQDSDSEAENTAETAQEQAKSAFAPANDRYGTEEFVGFRSGTGKKVQISEEALKKAQKMIGNSPNPSQSLPFQDSSPAINTELRDNGLFPLEFTTKACKPGALFTPNDPVSLSSISEDQHADAIPANFQLGFSTGSGIKAISISEGALNRAKLLFADDSDSEKEEKPEIAQNSGFSLGFVSGTGQKIPISEQSLQKVKNFFSDSPVSSQVPALKSNSSSCSVKILPKAPVKGRKPLQPPTTLKRSRGPMVFTTPKPVAGRLVMQPSTRRVLHPKAEESRPLKPTMRAYLGCEVLGSKGLFGKFSHIRPLLFEEASELVQLQVHLEATVGPSLGPSADQAWLHSQLRFLLWKYLSYSHLFPGFDSLLSESVLTQELTRRYTKETLTGHRSAVSRLLERDALPGSRFVLLIGQITYEAEQFRVELTDGWQSVWTVVRESDSLGGLFVQGKLRSGVKVELCNGLLEGNTFKLSLNSLRLAKWDSQLGLSPFQVPFRVSIRSISPDSGTISSLEVSSIRPSPGLSHLIQASAARLTIPHSHCVFVMHSLEGYLIKRYPPKFYIPSHKKCYSQAAVEEMEISREVQVRLSCLIRLKDALPGANCECFVTLERLNMDQWEAMREGMAVRCIGLEMSRFRPSYNGLLHLITHIFRLIPRKKIEIASNPQEQCTETTGPEAECSILGAILGIDCSPSQEILRLHILTPGNTVAEVKIHSHPFFGGRLTRLKGLSERQEAFVLFTNCGRDWEPRGTRLAVCTSDESELFTYLQGRCKADVEVLRALLALQPAADRFRVHQQVCGKGRCDCRSL